LNQPLCSVSEVAGAQGRIVRDAARELTRWPALGRVAMVQLPAASATVFAATGRIGAEAQVKARGNRLELAGAKLAARNVVVRKIHLRFSC
jgi:hypothetical protein